MSAPKSLTTTGERELIVRSVAEALAPAQEKAAEALVSLAASHESTREIEAENRKADRELWREMREDYRGVQAELRATGDRIVEAINKREVSQATAPAPVVDAAPNSITIPKAYLPWILILLLGGEAAPELLARYLLPVAPAPVAEVSK